ncbi:hypothetical protein SFUMM280S_03011 [Streptomyces fumanus]
MFALWEPPLTELEGEKGAPVRRTATAEAADLLTDLTVQGMRSIAFVRSRRGAELISVIAQERLAEVDRSLTRRVAAYRGGYLPEERRALERALHSGDLLGLAATNALELGVDISGLDAVVIAGYPGTRASLWQQAGRAGRAGQGALAVLVARDDPLHDRPDTPHGAEPRSEQRRGAIGNGGVRPAPVTSPPPPSTPPRPRLLPTSNGNPLRTRGFAVTTTRTWSASRLTVTSALSGAASRVIRTTASAGPPVAAARPPVRAAVHALASAAATTITPRHTSAHAPNITSTGQHHGRLRRARTRRRPGRPRRRSHRRIEGSGPRSQRECRPHQP